MLATILSMSAVFFGVFVVLIVARRWYHDLVGRLNSLHSSIRETTGAALLGPDSLAPWTPAAVSPWLLHFAREALARTTQPPKVLECGSGLSTLLLGESVAALGGTLIALEEDAEWAGVVNRLLARQGLDRAARVLHYPAVPDRILGVDASWYGGFDPHTYGLDRLDLLLVDGPKGSNARHARAAALPRLRELLTSRTAIFLDDAVRPAEASILELWSSEYAMDVEVLRIGRPFARLKLRDSDPPLAIDPAASSGPGTADGVAHG